MYIPKGDNFPLAVFLHQLWDILLFDLQALRFIVGECISGCHGILSTQYSVSSPVFHLYYETRSWWCYRCSIPDNLMVVSLDNTFCSICDIGFCQWGWGHHHFHSHIASYTVFRLPLQSSRLSGKWRWTTLMTLRRVRLSNFAPNSFASSLWPDLLF